MLVTPPKIQKKSVAKQPQKVEEPIEILQETSKNSKITTPKENSNSNTIQQSNNSKMIYKKKQYRQFLKLIKDNKFTTAMLTSKILGVDRSTVTSWLQTPKAIKELNNTIDSYVSDIAKAKDWKAKAYLIDKVEGTKEKEEARVDLKQLIVINTNN